MDLAGVERLSCGNRQNISLLRIEPEPDWKLRGLDLRW
jgi:hypothetical protein